MLFEYHCWESDQSQDADLWHRTHQWGTVTKCNGDRGDGCIMFGVTFSDGYQDDVFDDELLLSTQQYTRPEYQVKPAD